MWEKVVREARRMWGSLNEQTCGNNPSSVSPSLHALKISADSWADHLRLSDIQPKSRRSKLVSGGCFSLRGYFSL
jgi:hypothetical protein